MRLGAPDRLPFAHEAYQLNNGIFSGPFAAYAHAESLFQPVDASMQPEPKRRLAALTAKVVRVNGRSGAGELIQVGLIEADQQPTAHPRLHELPTHRSFHITHRHSPLLISSASNLTHRGYSVGLLERAHVTLLWHADDRSLLCPRL